MRGSAYDRSYRVLDLQPGAGLSEIEDRYRLLRDAFSAEALPPGLKPPAESRSLEIERAAGQLRDYWRRHGTAPPTTDLSGAEGLLDALVEALEDSATGSVSHAPGKRDGAEARARVPVAAAAAGARMRAGYRRPGFDARPLPAAPSGLPAVHPGVLRYQPVPDQRVQRIEIALEVVHRHVFVPPGAGFVPPARGPRTIRHEPSAGFTGAPRAIAGQTPAPTVAEAAVAERETSRPRRSPGIGSALLRLGAFGLAVALIAWLNLDRGDAADPDNAASGSGYAASAAAAAASVPQSAPRPTGAFAQPPARIPSLTNGSGYSAR